MQIPITIALEKTQKTLKSLPRPHEKEMSAFIHIPITIIKVLTQIKVEKL